MYKKSRLRVDWICNLQDLFGQKSAICPKQIPNYNCSEAQQAVAGSEADITKAIDKRCQDDQSMLGRHGRWEMEIPFKKYTRSPVDRLNPEQNKDCQSWVFIGMAQVTNRKRQPSTVRHKMKLPKKMTAYRQPRQSKCIH